MSEYVVDLTDVKKQKFSWSMEMLYDSVPVREEIVRCRDCVAYEPYLTYAGTKLDFGECMRHRRQADEDRFCAWAERSDA